MNLNHVNDNKFNRYGKIISGIDFTALLSAMQETPKPDDAVVYEPSIASLEAADAGHALQNIIFGEMPVQIGYCNGSNYLLNAVEYHHTSEVNIAATDMILLLGSEQDITADLTYDTSLIEGFFVPAGTAVELYATTLHYAPCNAGPGGFRVTVVLPRGTNTPLMQQHDRQGEDRLITAKNKWLIGHAEGGHDKGVHIGLKGVNISAAGAVLPKG